MRAWISLLSTVHEWLSVPLVLIDDVTLSFSEVIQRQILEAKTLILKTWPLGKDVVLFLQDQITSGYSWPS